jgi:hypothetical protein
MAPSISGLQKENQRQLEEIQRLQRELAKQKRDYDQLQQNYNELVRDWNDVGRALLTFGLEAWDVIETLPGPVTWRWRFTGDSYEGWAVSMGDVIRQAFVDYAMKWNKKKGAA